MSIPNHSSPLVPVHWPNMWWADSKGAANQSASKVQNRQHQKKLLRRKRQKRNHQHFKTRRLAARVTRPSLASVLGPFEVHLLEFTTRLINVLSGVTGISGYLRHTRGLPNLSYDCDLWKHMVFWLLLALLACRSFEAKDYWTFSHCIGFPFALVFTCTFTECVT